jgi:hypothetical protein
MTSLEGWSSTIELRPHRSLEYRRGRNCQHVAYRIPTPRQQRNRPSRSDQAVQPACDARYARDARSENSIGTRGRPAGSRYKVSAPGDSDGNRWNVSKSCSCTNSRRNPAEISAVKRPDPGINDVE